MKEGETELGVSRSQEDPKHVARQSMHNLLRGVYCTSSIRELFDCIAQVSDTGEQVVDVPQQMHTVLLFILDSRGIFP